MFLKYTESPINQIWAFGTQFPWASHVHFVGSDLAGSCVQSIEVGPEHSPVFWLQLHKAGFASQSVIIQSLFGHTIGGSSHVATSSHVSSPLPHLGPTHHLPTILDVPLILKDVDNTAYPIVIVTNNSNNTSNNIDFFPFLPLFGSWICCWYCSWFSIRIPPILIHLLYHNIHFLKIYLNKFTYTM